jgi:hypothetical protein
MKLEGLEGTNKKNSSAMLLFTKKIVIIIEINNIVFAHYTCSLLNFGQYQY